MLPPKKIALALALLLPCVAAYAQPNAFRSRTLAISADTTQLDTLSIVPGSLILRSEQGKIIPDSLYTVDYARSLLATYDLRLTTCSAAYRVFPTSFSKIYFSKESEKYVVRSENSSEKNRYFIPRGARRQSDGLLANSGLEHSGSLMRGVNVSTNSSAALTSEMNLQLSGKLTDELSLLATISDKNLPALPEGNTASLQEFDKIFISVYTNRASLSAGDLDLVETEDFFGKYQRKALGVSFAMSSCHAERSEASPEILRSAQNDKGQNHSQLSTLNSQLSAGVSKGKFARQTLAVVDGNQGPYLLSGTDAERYIVVLSGSERVYVDGRLQERGTDADYTISYATAELTFMPRRVITRSSRVVVEFEYSERSYARYIATSQNKFSGKKFKLHLNAFYEGDAKNQPIDENLSEADKLLMSEVGAQYWRAVAPDSSGANLRTLVTPKRKFMLTTGGVYTPDSLSSIALNAAMTNSSVNLFSNSSQAESTGVSVNVNGDKTWKIGKKNSIVAGAKVLAFDKNFSPPERFTPTEYERDWNIEGGLQGRNLQQYTGTVGYRHQQYFTLNTTASFLNLGATSAALSPLDTSFSAMQGENFTMDIGFQNICIKAADVAADISGKIWVSSSSTRQAQRSTEFARSIAETEESIGKYTMAVRIESEDNEIRNNGVLAPGSQAFQSYEFSTRSDSGAHRYRIAMGLRHDFLPKNNELEKAITTHELSATSAAGSSAVQHKLTASYRNLRYADSSARENLVLGREEIFLHLAQGAINSSILYELGSGAEPKQDYTYVEVGTGQGVYAWHDYNGDGIKELSEFEVAAFRDEAMYIRVALPSREYVQTYTGKFAFQLSLLPAMLWQNSVLARFSNLFSYSNAHKSLRNSFAKNANPFFGEALTDTSVVNQTYAALNTLTYLSRSARTKVEFSWQQNAAKQLLVNGFETRKNTTLALNARQRIVESLMLNAGVERAKKIFSSQYALVDKNYNILQHTILANGELTPSLRLRFSAKYSFSVKENTIGSETAQLHSAGVETTYNFPKKGVATGSFGFVSTTFNAKENTAVGYEMLQGYSTGRNLTWGATFKRVLGQGLELNLLYEGRKLSAGKVIHSGNVELRLLF